MSDTTFNSLTNAVLAGQSSLEDLKKLRKSLDIAVSRVAYILDKQPDQKLSIKSKTIEVCSRGPHCARRGSAELLAVLEEKASKDDTLTVIEGDCLRKCGLGPNLRLDGVVYTEMTTERLQVLLDHCQSKSELPVDLILNESNADEFLGFEEARSNLQLAYARARENAALLRALIEAQSESLPENRENRMLSIVLSAKAMKLSQGLDQELRDAREKLGGLVPLDAFVEEIFRRRLAQWKMAKTENL